MDLEDQVNLHIPWTQIITGVVVTIMGFMVWLAKIAGKQHLNDLAEMKRDLKYLRRAVEHMRLENAVIKTHLGLKVHHDDDSISLDRDEDSDTER